MVIEHHFSSYTVLNTFSSVFTNYILQKLTMVVIQLRVQMTTNHNLQLNESLFATGKTVTSKKGSSRGMINIQK
jgi:hypothetical protein